MNKEEARLKIAELVSKYQALSPTDKKAHTELDTRSNFIDPMFAALGWNMLEKKDVSREESAASGGRVDYAFKINGVTQFYLEAKKLKADLSNPDFMKQATTYAYGNGVTWAVLTNFEELRLLNALKSTPFLTLDCQDYTADFDKLWLLSRESLSGSLLDKEAVKYGQIPPNIPIEARLFKQLREWRTQLYNSLYLNDDKVKPEQRDEVIEKLFNRLIFIRTAEDRKLEDHLLLAAIHQWHKGGEKKGEIASALHQIFTQYNGYYDSELFRPHLLDSAELYLDEHVLADIMGGLYDITGGMASYDFAVIDADILGRVYEQYLGYVAKIEQEQVKTKQAQLGLGLAVEKDYKFVEKKAHRKEQGIYYTPKFVTDYIVKETVGRFIKENEVDGYEKIRNIKILDPACGSGSFLIRAYDELLNYHANVRGKASNELAQADRMPILTGNIFGVDLDQQAVEIARLNLLLRGLAKREYLPPLTNNIKRGNSLISGTEHYLKPYFGKEWKNKAPFNWDEEFKDVMVAGGFNVVIGNPPYIQLSMEHGLDPNLKNYLLDKYKSSMGRLNTFGFFIKQGIELIQNHGYLGFIVPNTVISQDYYEDLRRFILDTCVIKGITSFEGLPFKDAVVENVVLILQKENSDNARKIHKTEINSFNRYLAIDHKDCIYQESFYKSRKTSFNFRTNQNPDILKKIETDSRSLSEFLNINQAIALKHERGKWVTTANPNDNYKPLLVGGRNINRYSIDWDRHFLLYDKEGIHSGGEEQKFKAKEKIFFRRVSDRLIGALDTEQFYGLHTLVVMSPKKKIEYRIIFLLAIFNSNLLNYYYHSVFASTKSVFSEIGARQIGQLPIKAINLSKASDKILYSSIVKGAERITELNKKLAPIRDHYSNEHDELVKEIAKTDRAIDELVYDLYGLTEEERELVKNASK